MAKRGFMLSARSKVTTRTDIWPGNMAGLRFSERKSWRRNTVNPGLWRQAATDAINMACSRSLEGMYQIPRGWTWPTLTIIEGQDRADHIDPPAGHRPTAKAGWSLLPEPPAENRGSSSALHA